MQHGKKSDTPQQYRLRNYRQHNCFAPASLAAHKSKEAGCDRSAQQARAAQSSTMRATASTCASTRTSSEASLGVSKVMLRAHPLK